MKRILTVLAILSVFAAGFAQTVGVMNVSTPLSEAKITGYWGPVYGNKGKTQVPHSRAQSDATPDLFYEAETPHTLDEVIKYLNDATVSQLKETKLCQVKDNAKEGDSGIDYLLKLNLLDFSGSRNEEFGHGEYTIKIGLTLVNCASGETALAQYYESENSRWSRMVESKGGFGLSMLGISKAPQSVTLPEDLARTKIAIDVANAVVPPTVIETKADGTVTCRSLGLSEDDMLYILDESRVLVGEVVVYDVNEKTGIASAMPDPEGAHTEAKFEKGMFVRPTNKGDVSSGMKTEGERAKKRVKDFIKENEKSAKKGLAAPALDAQDLGGKPVVGIAAAKNLVKEIDVTGYWGDIYYRKQEMAGGLMSVNAAYSTKKTSETPDLLASAKSLPNVGVVLLRLQDALFDGFADTGRFAVTERPNGASDGLDYIVDCELKTVTADRIGIPQAKEKNTNTNINSLKDLGNAVKDAVTDAVSTKEPGSCTYTMSVNIKVTDVKSGEVVFQQEIQQDNRRKTGKHSAMIINAYQMPDVLGEKAAIEATKMICPSKVLDVKDGIIRIPAIGLEEKQVIDIQNDSDAVVAEAVVFKIDRRIANAMVDPLGSYANAEIAEGMSVVGTDKDGKAAVKNVENEIKNREKASKAAAKPAKPAKKSGKSKK